MTDAEKKAKEKQDAAIKKLVDDAVNKAVAAALKIAAVEKDEAVEAALKENKSKAKGRGLKTAKAGKYVAIRKCYFGISLYVKGAPYHATEGEKIPYHFKKVKDDPIETDEDYVEE